MREVAAVYKRMLLHKSQFEDAEAELDGYINAILNKIKELRQEYDPYSKIYPIIRSVENVPYEWSIDVEDHKIWFSWESGYDDGRRSDFSIPMSFLFAPRLFQRWKDKLEKDYQEWLSSNQLKEKLNKIKLLQSLRADVAKIEKELEE